MRRSPFRACPGQASLEYLAAIALIATLLLAAGASGAVPGVGERVAHTVRLGICLVAGDVCRTGDARAAGLAPCAVEQEVRGGGAAVTVAAVRFGAHGEYTAAYRSDGTVAVTLALDGSVAATAGVAFAYSPADMSAQADAALEMQGTAARGWTFPSAAAARAFISGLPLSAVDDARWPAQWQSFRGGDEARAALQAATGEHVLAAAQAAAALGAGARIERRGAATILLDAGYHAEASLVDGATGLGSREARVYAEYTLDHSGPRALVLRSATAANGQLVERTFSLDLHEPANLAAARPLISAKVPWPPAAVRQVDAVLAQARRTGVIERTVWDVRDSSRGFDVAAKLGLKLGLEAKKTRIDRHLRSASAWTDGSRERERYDCLSAAR